MASRESLSVGEGGGHTMQPVSQLRRGLPQYTAAVIKNLLLMDLGMVIAFPTIVIPPLETATEGLRFTPEQASWFGSLVYFCQPVGAIAAGFTLESLGRKRSMIFLNLPFLICWVALYFTDSVTLLFVLNIIMGVGIGSIEAAILTYVGEISEPRLRGTLTSFAEIAEYVGFVLIFFLGTVTDWRTSALISAVVPVVTMACLTQVPETPIWLLSRGRKDDAMKSLCWLRGWVKPNQVQSEYEEIVLYNKSSKIPPRMLQRLKREQSEKHSYSNSIRVSEENVSSAQETDNNHKVNGTSDNNKFDLEDNFSFQKTNNVKYEDGSLDDSLLTMKIPFKEKIIDFFRPEMMRPMFLVCSFFFFTYGSGMVALRPYLVPVFIELGIEMDPFLATTVFTVIGLGGCVVCTVSVRFVGKRPLALISIVGCGVSSILSGVYAIFIDQLGDPGHSWIPMVLMVAWVFFTGVGMDPLPWMYLSEVFPFRGRSLACGVAAAISYVFGFIATKTVLMLEETLTLAGVFFVYAGFNIVGTIYFYFYLPETEGMSMEDIEECYKKNMKISR